MFRKTVLALTTVATLGAATLVPTAASAHGYGGWHPGHHWHGRHWHDFCFWKPFYGYYGYKRWS